MNVTLINQEQAVKLHETWGSFARVCYNSPEGREVFIGKGCHNTGHYSGSRTTYFIFHITGVSRALTAQLNRHSIGVVINEKSMRYVNFSDAEITMPPSIENISEARSIFNDLVRDSKYAYSQLVRILGENGIEGEMANQDARYVCPLGTQTEGMWAFTIEALEHFMNKRLCERSQWEIRNMANLMRDQVVATMNSPLISKRLVAHCFSLGYCPENRMQCEKYCKVMPTRDEHFEIKKSSEYINLVYELKKQKEEEKQQKLLAKQQEQEQEPKKVV